MQTLEIFPDDGTEAIRETVTQGLYDQADGFSELHEKKRLASCIGFDDQIAMEAAASYDALFLHTVPLYLGTRPFIFHFESFTSLFWPWLVTGSTMGCPLKQTEFFWHVKRRLESSQCRAIFSHMREGLDTVAKVFGSDIITAKLRHIPLGFEVRESPKPDGPLRILFTNSLHRLPASFYFRGGHHIIEAVQRTPNTELTIVSSVPNDIQTRFPKMERVTWIKDRVDDATLNRLFATAHVFALPAAGLHSHSLLRAMAHGCVPLVSYAPGYNEYTQNLDVMRIVGVFDLVYRKEPDGWIGENYEPFQKRVPVFVDQIAAQLTETHLRQRGAAVLEHCRQNFSVAKSHAAFNGMLGTL